MNSKNKEWYQKNKKRILRERKVYYQKNKERLQAYGRKHAKNNPEIYLAARHRRRTAIRNNGRNDLTAEQIKWLFKNFPQCFYCKRENDLTIDHVIPISKGGQNTLSNIVPACSECNNMKRAKLEFEFKSIGTLSITGCPKCFEVRTDRILTSEERSKVHEKHT